MSPMSEIESADRTPDEAESLLRGLLGEFQECRLRVTGSCMEPALHEGDSVTLARPTTRAPRFGDIVLVRAPQGLRLHRVLWPMPGLAGALRTKGDRSRILDPPLLPVAVVGIVTSPREAAIERLARSFLSAGRAIFSRSREAFPCQS
jgi:hypothetical protein